VHYSFSAQLWLWDARKNDSWTFLSVPADLSAEIREFAATLPRAGFGSVRVTVRIGGTAWSTSIFPDAKRAEYVLPVKKAVRSREGVEAGDTVGVELDLELELG
jgi:hypothetical protein